MKRISIIIVTLLLSVALAGCNNDSLVDYKKAVEKTEQIKTGQTSGEFSLSMVFNTEGMTAEQIKELNYLKDLRGDFNAAYDYNSGKKVFRNYLNFGGLGFDFDLFMDGEEMFLKLPVIGKYMKLEDMKSSINMDQKADGECEFISKGTLDEISGLWIGLLKKEDVFKGKDIILTTPDGEVKTTEYTIKLSDQQIKILASDVMKILSKDEKLRKNVDEYINNNLKQEKTTSFDELISNFREGIKNYNVENFSYTAYVDIDGYIVNEIIEVALSVDHPKQASPTYINYELDIKNWDINKEQKFDFPVLTKENTLKMDEMEETMPFMMEDLFNSDLFIKEDVGVE